MDDVSQIIERIDAGDLRAAEHLLPLVYNELRALAAARLANEKPGQTLQPTALVHEAYLRLVGAENAQNWNGRGHFFAAAAEAMRRILVERARRKHRQRHGGSHQRVALDESDLAATTSDDRLLAIHDALDALAGEDPLAAEITKLRYFAGFTLPEAAEILGISRTSVCEQWAYARAWLRREIDGLQES